MKFFLSCLLEFLVKESQRCRGAAPGALLRVAQSHSGVNGKWPAQGRALGCPITATRRTAWPPWRAAQPAHITRPTHSAASPPAARPHPERARERVAGAARAGPTLQGQAALEIQEQRLQQARGPTKQLFSSHSAVEEQLTGCVPVFVCYRLLLGRHSGLSLALNYQSKELFCQKRITASFLRQVDGFFKGMSLGIFLRTFSYLV